MSEEHEAEIYHRNECTCRALAAQAATPADRDEWLQMAEAWSRRAAETAREKGKETGV